MLADNTIQDVIIQANPVHLSLGSYIDNPVGTLTEIIQNPAITHVTRIREQKSAGPLGPKTPTPPFRYVLQFLYKDISLPDDRLDRAIARLTTEYDHRHANVRYSKQQLDDGYIKFRIEIYCDALSQRKMRLLLASLCLRQLLLASDQVRQAVQINT